MTDKQKEKQAPGPPEEDGSLTSRREFLLSLKKWSKSAIGIAIFGAAVLEGTSEAEGGAWVNRRGGGVGRPWANGTSWVNGGGGGWVNRRGGGGWANGGGGSWANGRLPGGWINRR